MRPRKPEGDNSSANENWRQLCTSLLAERDRLLGRVSRVTEENKLLKKSLGTLLREELPINKMELLSQFGSEPSLPELIAELEKAME